MKEYFLNKKKTNILKEKWDEHMAHYLQIEHRFCSYLATDMILNVDDLVRNVKSLRISWFEHVERMKNERTPTYILNDNIVGVRMKERPRDRRLQDEYNLKRMGVRR